MQGSVTKLIQQSIRSESCLLTYIISNCLKLKLTVEVVCIKDLCACLADQMLECPCLEKLSYILVEIYH